MTTIILTSAANLSLIESNIQNIHKYRIGKAIGSIGTKYHQRKYNGVKSNTSIF